MAELLPRKKRGGRVKPITYVKLAKYGYIITSVALILIGVRLLFNPNLSMNLVYYILGGVLMVYGLIRIVGYFSRDLYQLAFQYDLAFGILMIALGIVIVFQAWGIEEQVHTIYGTLILTDSLYKIQVAIDSKRFGIEKWYLILVLAIITGVLGMVLIAWSPLEFRKAMVLIGLASLFEGIMCLDVSMSVIKVTQNQRFDTER